ncbi:conserved exported hypothetical protein [Tenacibaculum dicentrarchi]|nr:conserved exported hypothetical protein [Tenacibaculum dicentrarchi]
MKKQLLIILLLFNISLSISQNDSLNKIQFENLNKKIEHQNNTLLKNNDSLRIKLLSYQAKEDYFSVALADQSNRFVLITGTIIGLLALISFAGFRNEITRLKKQYENQVDILKKEFKEHQTKTLKHDYSLEIASGNIFALAAQTFENKHNLFLALEFYLSSARAHSKAGVLMKKDDSKDSKDVEDTIVYARVNIEKAIELLKTITVDEEHIEICKEKKEDLISELNDIIETKDSDLIDLCSECRIIIKNYTK